MSIIYAYLNKSLLIDRDSYLLECGRYVELNPVRAGLVPYPSAYPWSSYQVYSEGVKNPLVNRNPLYDSHGTTLKRRQTQYRRFVADGLRKSAPQGLFSQPFWGSPSFRERMAVHFGLSMTQRPRGRPRKETDNASPKNQKRPQFSKFSGAG